MTANERIPSYLFLVVLCACGSANKNQGTTDTGGTTSGATTGSTAGSGAPCQDLDGDGRGLDCSAGADCNENSPAHWDDCTTCVDTDHDDYGDACNLGDDCDDTNLRAWMSCDTCHDADGDGHWAGCDAVDASADCDDNAANLYQQLSGFTDADGDNYGAEGTAHDICSGAALPAGTIASSLGLDCEDSNPNYNATCPGKLLGDLNPGHAPFDANPAHVARTTPVPRQPLREPALLRLAVVRQVPLPDAPLLPLGGVAAAEDVAQDAVGVAGGL